MVYTEAIRIDEDTGQFKPIRLIHETAYGHLLNKIGERIPGVISVGENGIQTITLPSDPNVQEEIRELARAKDVGLEFERMEELVKYLETFGGFERNPSNDEDPNNPIILTRDPNKPERTSQEDFILDNK